MSMTEPGRGSHKAVIVPVQFLRGVAASFVVTVHLLERLVKRGAFPQGLPDWVWSFGEMGIATFFAISGFIMVHTTATDFGRPHAPGRFFARRFIRLAPIYYLTSAMMAVYYAMTHSMSTNASYAPPSVGAVVMSALFIPYDNDRGVAVPVYELGWTLNYEMLFYAIFALAMALSRRRGLVAIFAALLGLVAAGMLIARPEIHVDQPVVAYFFTRPLLLYFVIGMVLALLRQMWGTWQVTLADWLPCLVAAMMLGLGVRFGSRGVGAGSAVAVAVALATLVEGRAGRASRFDAASRRFGDSSYSLYLTHSFLLGGIAVVAAPFAARGTLALIVLMLATCLACAVVAWCVWRWGEAPLTRMLLRRFGLSSGGARRPESPAISAEPRPDGTVEADSQR